MPKPSLIKPSLIESRLAKFRVLPYPVFHLPRRQQAILHTAPQASAFASRSFGSRVSFGLLLQKRKMSTPADHKPAKQAPKVPPVPRPSARYVNMKTIIAVHSHIVVFSSFLQRTKFCFCTVSNKPRALQPHMSSQEAHSVKRMMARYQT